MNMYGFPYPPPNEDTYARAFVLAEKIKAREHKRKLRAKEAEEKKAKEAGRGMLLAIEWFIIGVVLQPFVGTAYQIALHKLTVMP